MYEINGSSADEVLEVRSDALISKTHYLKWFVFISALSAAVLFIIPNAIYFAQHGLVGGSFPFSFVFYDLLVNLGIGVMIAAPLLFFREILIVSRIIILTTKGFSIPKTPFPA